MPPARSLCCLWGLGGGLGSRRGQERGLSPQRHRGLSGGKVAFSWELEGQKPSRLISEDIWESASVQGTPGEWLSWR